MSNEESFFNFFKSVYNSKEFAKRELINISFPEIVRETYIALPSYVKWWSKDEFDNLSPMTKNYYALVKEMTSSYSSAECFSFEGKKYWELKAKVWLPKEVWDWDVCMKDEMAPHEICKHFITNSDLTDPPLAPNCLEAAK